MTKEEFTDKLQRCFFGEKSAFREITQYFETLQRELNEKDKVIKEAINVLNYINNGEICDNVTILANKLLEILERTDK